MGGLGSQGSCSGRGGTWLGLPSLLHSPNFHQTLGPRLPETKTQQALDEPRTARRGGLTPGGTEPREADATFPLRKPPGRTAVRTQHAWAGGCSMVRGLREAGAAARTSVCLAVGLGVWWLRRTEPQD